MATLEVRAEVMKLAHRLGVDSGELSYLQRLCADDVRALNQGATDALFENDRRFGRVALAARIPPAGMTAWIAQHLFGALLCARVAGQLETRRAIDLAQRMAPAFLADLAIELDPRRAREIIFGLPPALIGEVAAELTERREYIAMGRFVGNMTDAGIRAAFAVIDDLTLLRISYFVEEKDHLDHVVGLLEIERVRNAIRGASEADLWPQALDLLTRVSPQRAGALADLAAEEDDPVLEGMVAAACREDLWSAVLPVTQNMSEAGRRRFATLPALHAPDVIATIAEAAVAADLLADLMPLAELMPAEAQQRVRALTVQ